LGFFAYETLQKGGFSLGIKDEEDGSLKSLVIFREYDPAKEKRHSLLDKIRDFVTSFRAYFSMKGDPVGLPKILDDPLLNKKFQSSSTVAQQIVEPMHKWHTQYAPQQKHWYVAIVASDIDCQGKGYGKKVIDLLGQAADQIGIACYLECPDYNRKFYEKCGYTATKATTMSLSDPTLGDLSSPGYLMTREPKKSS